MASNSREIIQDIRTEFDLLLEYVTGEEARTATADQVERGLFKMLLQLGAQLLHLFFVMRAEGYSHESLQVENGQILSYDSEKKRTYFSVFGKLAVWRPYFYKKGVGGRSPLDAELSLGEDRYSDLLREVIEYLAVYVTYDKATEILERFLGLTFSTRALQESIAADTVDVESYYEEKPPPPVDEEAEVLVIQADGKGVPLVVGEPAQAKVRLGKGEKRGRKKEAIVTTVYTIAAALRRPEEVVASFFYHERDVEDKKKPPKPQHKHIWATLDGKDAALERLARRVAPRQGDHIRYRVALCDGCEALQSRIEKQFSDFSLILDFIHANEYLWKVANSLLGETNEQRTEWVADQTLQMLSGQTEQIIADFRTLAQEPDRTPAQREKLLKTANYFERNLPYMDYPTYLAKGWPIASGVIEGACRHFVKDRFELSGMRWSQAGAENLLRLRSVAENDDWDAYHRFRKHQRHLRLYTSSYPGRNAPELQSLDRTAPVDAPLVASDRQVSAVSSSGNLEPIRDYQALPLAS
jgi:hypothetical protein